MFLQGGPVSQGLAAVLPSGPWPRLVHPVPLPIHAPCPATLCTMLAFLRLSTTVMFYFFAVKFNHIQVLPLVFLTNESVHGNGNSRKTYDCHYQRYRWGEELIGWPDDWYRKSIRDSVSAQISQVGLSNHDTVHNQICLTFTTSFCLSLSLYWASLGDWKYIEFFDFHSPQTECNQTTAQRYLLS